MLVDVGHAVSGVLQPVDEVGVVEVRGQDLADAFNELQRFVIYTKVFAEVRQFGFVRVRFQPGAENVGRSDVIAVASACERRFDLPRKRKINIGNNLINEILPAPV